MWRLALLLTGFVTAYPAAGQSYTQDRILVKPLNGNNNEAVAAFH